jgi:hypothetical protein
MGVLEILPVNTIVANLGEGEHQDLTEIARIGEGFHIPGHLRIEHKFTGALPFNTKPLTYNELPIFETQNRLHDFPL